LLPDGSKYTGIDKEEKLIFAAKEMFSKLPYQTEFMVGDINQIQLAENKYDVATCQALLLQLPNPKETLARMIKSVKGNGLIICIEPHWNSGMANFYIQELEASKTANLGLLQKLYENDKNRTRRDGNIGIKLPAYMRELGLKNVNCRISGCVRYLNPDLPEEEKQTLFTLLCNEGFGAVLPNSDDMISDLMNRGLTLQEAQEQLEIEKYVNQHFRESGLEYNTLFASTMMISYGIKSETH
jgi:ubiquinone/menaquinone biosynthesis C-methylase UbiE